MPHTFQGPQLGKYGTQVGSVVEFYWVPDPVVISQRILRTRDNLEDRTIPLAVSRGIVARDVEQNFEGEHDPEGNPWAPWATAYHASGERQFTTDAVTGKQYVAKKSYGDRLPPGHSGKILDFTGALRAAATDESAYVQMSGKSVHDDSLFMDTGGLPPYWKFHESGTWKMPVRRFLGMSGEAEILILEEFEKWFVDVIGKATVRETYTSSAGRTFTRRRIPKGQPGAGQFAPNA